jgi:hypothetical protein
MTVERVPDEEGILTRNPDGGKVSVQTSDVEMMEG